VSERTKDWVCEECLAGGEFLTIGRIPLAEFTTCDWCEKQVKTRDTYAVRPEWRKQVRA